MNILNTKKSRTLTEHFEQKKEKITSRKLTDNFEHKKEKFTNINID